jgi:Tfp pilus assembly protein PilO
MTFMRTYKTYLTRAAIVWVVSLVLCLLAYMIVIRPQSNSMQRLDDTLAEQRQVYASAVRATQEQTRIQLAKQTERLQEQVESLVTDFKASSDLTFDISQIANRENLSSLSVAMRAGNDADQRGIGANTQIKQVSEHHIDIKFTAGFHQFATFVNALERHKPILFVDKFKIARSSREDSTYQVTLDVAAFIKRQPEKQTANAALTSTLSAEI